MLLAIASLTTMTPLPDLMITSSPPRILRFVRALLGFRVFIARLHESNRASSYSTLTNDFWVVVMILTRLVLGLFFCAFTGATALAQPRQTCDMSSSSDGSRHNALSDQVDNLTRLIQALPYCSDQSQALVKQQIQLLRQQLAISGRYPGCSNIVDFQRRQIAVLERFPATCAARADAERQAAEPHQLNPQCTKLREEALALNKESVGFGQRYNATKDCSLVPKILALSRQSKDKCDAWVSCENGRVQCGKSFADRIVIWSKVASDCGQETNPVEAQPSRSAPTFHLDAALPGHAGSCSDITGTGQSSTPRPSCALRKPGFACSARASSEDCLARAGWTRSEPYNHGPEPIWFITFDGRVIPLQPPAAKGQPGDTLWSTPDGDDRRQLKGEPWEHQSSLGNCAEEYGRARTQGRFMVNSTCEIERQEKASRDFEMREEFLMDPTKCKGRIEWTDDWENKPASWWLANPKTPVGYCVTPDFHDSRREDRRAVREPKWHTVQECEDALPGTNFDIATNKRGVRGCRFKGE